MGSVFFRKTRNPSICGKAAVGYARIDAVSVTVISGSNKRIVLSASSWFSGVLPAQAHTFGQQHFTDIRRTLLRVHLPGACRTTVHASIL